MSNSVRPHRWQPTRLPRPWDSPGKKTGVGCHFPLQCLKVKSGIKVVQSCPTLSNLMDCSLPGSSVHGIFRDLWLGSHNTEFLPGRCKVKSLEEMSLLKKAEGASCFSCLCLSSCPFIFFLPGIQSCCLGV